MHGMHPQRWQRLRRLLDAALDLAPGRRAAYLAALDGDDAELRDDLQRLLLQHARDEQEAPLDPFAVVAPLLQHDGALDAEADRSGQQIGVYRLLRLIGSGGMGSVYLAERSSDNFVQRVAFKVIRGEVASSALRERFERERQILARLVHPHIAPLYDGGQTAEGQPFYTMEYVDGVPITEYCAAQLPDPRSRVRLLVDVAGALACAHQNLIVHRDIKPSNILVDAAGRAKLLDFGIAKPMGANDAALTQVGFGPMTPEYAAPEQFRNAPVTVATDIYQFGVLCYRVLAGRLPYRADPGDSYAWSRAVSEDDPLRLRVVSGATSITGEAAPPARGTRVTRALNADLDAILRKAMAKRPGDRYRSMDALSDDLQAFLDHRPIGARPMGALFYAWRFVVRRPFASAAAALALLGMIATTLIAVRQAELKAHEAERANAEARHADAVADFLIGLFKVSDPGINRGERLNANEILARGAAQVEHEFAAQPDQRLRLQTVIAEVYAAMGDYPRTRPLLEQAIAGLRRQPAADPATLGHDLQLLGWLSAQQTDRSGALELFAEAEQVLSSSAAPAAQDDLIRLYLHRGLTRLWNGEFAAGEAGIRAGLALALDTRGPDSEMAALAHQDLGSALNTLGQLQASKSETDIALQTYRRVLGDDHPDTLNSQANLGWSMAQLGDLDGAHALLLDVVERQRRVVGESNKGYGEALNQLGLVELRQGSYDQAIAHFLAAEAAYHRALGDNYLYLAMPIIVNRGRALVAQEKFAEALTIFEQAYAERQADLPTDHPELAETLMFMAECLIPLGRPGEALADAERALSIYRRNAATDPLDLAKALLRLGLAQRALGQGDQARIAWREALAVTTQPSSANSWLAAGIRRRILTLDPGLVEASP